MRNLVLSKVLAIFLTLTFWVIFNSYDLQAQNRDTLACDGMVKPSSNISLAYSKRNGRWEGLYIRPVSGTVLLSEFTRGEIPEIATSPIELSWQPQSESFLILSTTYRPDLNYIMCTDNSLSSQNNLSWETSILRELKFERQEIGITGSIMKEISGKQRKVYFPVKIGQNVNLSYNLILVPDFELEELYLSIIPCADDWTAHSAMARIRIDSGYFAPGHPIRLPVSELTNYRNYCYYIEWVKDTGLRGYNRFWIVLERE